MGVTPDPDAAAAFVAHTERIKATLQPHLSGGVYLNFLDGEEAGDRRTRDGFSAGHFARLTALKAAVDPHNRLGFSFDIRPEPATA